jgi:hypothetical protein
MTKYDMKLTKHVGKLKDLETKVLVVFMQLPEDKTHSLVCATHTLPDLIQDEILRLVDTDECQKEKDLATFLNRKTLTNAGGGSILSWLHKNGKLIKVPCTAVIMIPHPGHPIALTELLKHMSADELPKEPHTDMKTEKVLTSDEKVAIAKNLLIEAQMLREEADKKEKQAHGMMPSDCFEEKTAKKTKVKKTKKTEV